VVPAFDAAQGFGFDKPAHLPCMHLRADCRCGIHAELPAQGFAACAAFDCHGAGQYVTQNLFDGGHWRDSPERAAAMFAVYPRVRILHETLALLTLGLAHVSEEGARARIRARIDEIVALRAMVAQGDSAIDLTRLARETLAWLRAQCGPRGMPPSASE
jgi:hypothetical protein